MTIGSWDPSPQDNHSVAYQLEIEFLKKIILHMTDNDVIDLHSYLDSDEQKKHAAVMTLPKETWFSMKDALSNDDIILLIKFFTLAEMKFSHWTANDSSPVIWLAKILRQKGQRIEADLLQWIKSNSDNKFLPYGAL
jgi:hypothetical protein